MQNRKLENILNLALETPKEIRRKSADLSAGYQEREDCWELIVKYHGDILRLAGDSIRVEILIPEYAIVTISENLIPAFSSMDEIESIEQPKRLFLQETIAEEVSYSIWHHQKQEKLNGKGCLAAVIDSGIKYELPMFQNEDRTTKIVWMWDQNMPKGKEIDRRQMNEKQLGHSNAEEFMKDINGHGTAVASIIMEYAPKADFLAVKLDTNNDCRSPLTTGLMRALSYAVLKAAERNQPVAVNISHGNTLGARDGSSVLERFVNAVSEIGRTVICAGSGNEGASGGHYEGKFENPFDILEVEFSVGNRERELSMQLWKNFSDEFQIILQSPDGRKFSLEYGKTESGSRQAKLGDAIVLVYRGTPKPNTQMEEFYFQFLADTDFITSGIWKLRLIPFCIVSGQFHLYMTPEAARCSNTRFLFPSPLATLTIPATARKIITVGAYDLRFRAYADFSSRGYVCNDVFHASEIVKPELCAPGVSVLVPGREGERMVSGTSFAAPAVTGTALLLMQWGITNGKDEFLYGERLKAYLCKGAKQLPGITQWPNPQVGWGALSVADSLLR